MLTRQHVVRQGLGRPPPESQQPGQTCTDQGAGQRLGYRLRLGLDEVIHDHSVIQASIGTVNAVRARHYAHARDSLAGVERDAEE